MGSIQQRILGYLTLVSLLLISYSPAAGGQIRLAGSGSTRCSGRVEMYYNDTWGTVCDDDWDLNDVKVVCRELGCGTALSAPPYAHFGEGTGQIWLDDVDCSGVEDSITECQHGRFGQHKCSHYEDAGVICSGGQIMLAGSGSTQCSGRVEIYYNDTWGTVCNDYWDLNDAEVVCRGLGCGRPVSAPQLAHFGKGTGQIWLDDVNCSGSESSIIDCQHREFGAHNCEHSEDAGVICSGVEIRLTGSGSTQCSGRVEMYYNDTWGTVCDDDWDLNDANVVCRQLGCGTALSAPQSAHFGEGTGQIWLDDVDCSGSERSLTECQHRGFGQHKCSHSRDAGVVCSGVQIRLTGSGSTLCSGRVEIYLNDTWGTICDDSWDFNDAKVVCRELGCGTALSAPQSAHFDRGTGQIWLDDVGCSGSERSLSECLHKRSGTDNCGHAGVVCSGVRLVGSTRCSGRVEIYHNGTWGTVCDDEWGLSDAEVVCRELGCGTAQSVPQLALFGEGTGPIWLDDVDCSGSERSLTQCQHRGFGTNNCGHGEDAGVVCSGVQIRLTGSGSTQCSGRIEIYYHYTWGTVCDDRWDLNDANVVCRQLGCGTALSAPQSAHFGEGTGQIWLDDVGCSGSESSITECQHRGFAIHNCGHSEDAGVVCSGVEIRLSGSTLCSGRVEMYYNDTWGTVCDDDWDFNDAKVVCRELGCGTALSAPPYAHFGEGTGQIWLHNVACSGSERSLTQCQHGGFGTHNCGHSRDAGVVCSGIEIRLTGSGSTRCSGRVEINHNGAWGTVCDDNWDLNDALVVCRELGCGTALSAPQSAHFGEGTGQIWLDDVDCSGSERSLSECQHRGFGTHNCGHGEDAGVVCSVSLPKPSISMNPAGEVTWGQDVAITCSISTQHLGGTFILRKTSGSFRKTQTSSINSATFSILKVGLHNEGLYQCQYKKGVSGREFRSSLSNSVKLSITAGKKPNNNKISK